MCICVYVSENRKFPPWMSRSIATKARTHRHTEPKRQKLSFIVEKQLFSVFHLFQSVFAVCNFIAWTPRPTAWNVCPYLRVFHKFRHIYGICRKSCTACKHSTASKPNGWRVLKNSWCVRVCLFVFSGAYNGTKQIALPISWKGNRMHCSLCCCQTTHDPNEWIQFLVGVVVVGGVFTFCFLGLAVRMLARVTPDKIELMHSKSAEPENISCSAFQPV